MIEEWLKSLGGGESRQVTIPITKIQTESYYSFIVFNQTNFERRNL